MSPPLHVAAPEIPEPPPEEAGGDLPGLEREDDEGTALADWGGPRQPAQRAACAIGWRRAGCEDGPGGPVAIAPARGEGDFSAGPAEGRGL